ncbi:MAG: DUF5655 domain-containing protein [Saprospiraceae bacterium]|nr:DUF5655 domain-containing protein [Saprospiraceae bacterium]
MCSTRTIDEIFEGKPDELILAFDQVLIHVIDWNPCSVGAATNAIVFTKEKAWLIVKPMAKLLDLKFYHPEKIEHHLIKRTVHYRKVYAHHIRIADESEVTPELLSLLRMGYDAY